eukprot:jgi/Tetstr1/449333/TSEL_003848.t1
MEHALRSLITARAVVDHLYGTMPQTASTNLRERQPTHVEWFVAAAMEDVLSHPCKLGIGIGIDRQPPPDTSPSVAEAAPDEAAKFGTTRSGAPTAQKSWTGRRVFRTNFFSSLVSSNKVARSRAAEERLVGAQQVADSQCEVAARDAHATVTQLQPERRDALLDSKLRHEYNFESDLVKDCSVEEHRALDSEIQALHAKGRLRGLDVAGIVAATDDALTSSVSPEAAGIDGRPLASYIEVERASLIDSLHTSFGAPKSWIETAGGQAGARVEGDNAASAKKPKGKKRGSLLFALTESQLQAAAITKAQREKQLIDSATNLASKEEWVRSAVEWPEHKCVGFGKGEAQSDTLSEEKCRAEMGRSTFAAGANTPRKVRGAPAHGASLGNEADFLRQPAKPHASASLGSSRSPLDIPRAAHTQGSGI